LTAAALLAPVVLPPEFPYPLPPDMPDSVTRYRETLAARRSVGWAAEMYRRHRGRSAELPSSPTAL
ncbi:MAG TPA: hypothetical protein VLA79_04485, partial [Polyangia bacterium]|nr:hypothetical protein [Polyangia bacterium]